MSSSDRGAASPGLAGWPVPAFVGMLAASLYTVSAQAQDPAKAARRGS